MVASPYRTVAPSVDSPEFWRRAERTEVSSDPDVATAQVVRRMCELARASAPDPVFRACAESAVRQFRGGPLWAAAGLDPLDWSQHGRREAVIAESAWWCAKQYLRFVHHSRMIWDRLRERDQWQLLISPDVLVRMWPMKGDCAVYSCFIAAILECWGVPWELVTVSGHWTDEPNVFSHVYPRAVTSWGRLPLDASHGKYPGWRVPAAEVVRSQVWDSGGRPVSDSGEFGGLHYYAMSRGRRGVSGLGDVCTFGTADYDPAACEASSAPVVGTPTGLPTYGPAFGPTGPPVTAPPPAGGFNFGSALSNLLSQWTNIGGRVIAPTVTYTRGPGGAISYSAPAGSSAGGAVPFLGATAGGGSSLLWIGAGVLAVVFAFSLSKGGR